MQKIFSMSIIWKILTGLLLSLSLTFIALFQNQVESIFPAFLSWQRVYVRWWFSWHMLSDMKRLPENFIFNLFRSCFLLTSTLRLSFLELKFTITDSFFFKRWEACTSPGLTSCPVKGSAFQMFSSSSSSLINGGDRFYLYQFSPMALSISNSIHFQLNNCLS